jgi:hypothetical protein
VADEPRNRVELEYGARVDRASMSEAKAEAVRNAEETARAVSQVAGKPQNVANAEAATRAAAGREAEASATRNAAEATKRLQAEQDRLYTSVSRVNDRALELENGFRRLGNSRYGDSLNRQASIGETRINALRNTLINLRKILEDPASQDPKVIARIGPLADAAEKRLAVLERRLERMNAAAGGGGGRGADPFDLGDAAGRAGGGGGGNGGGGNGGGGLNPFMARRIAQVGAQAVGLPGIAGSIGGLEAMGGGLAAVGIVLGAVAGIRELIKLSNEAEKSQFNLAAAAHNTGESFQQARDDAEVFRDALGVTREDANALAASLAQLRLRTGSSLNNEETRQLATLVRAQGLEGKEGADALSGLAKGSAEAFEQLTGSRADITLDRYARSLGTTVSRLTDMQKAQILTNAALKDSAELQALAEKRTGSLAQKTDSFFNSLKDFGAEYGRAFYEGVILNQSAAESAAARLKEGGAGAGSNAEHVAQLQAQRRRVEEEREANRQAEARIAEERRFEEEARAARALPEEYGAGLSPVGRGQAELARLRARRDAVQTAFSSLQGRRDEFSTDDFKKFSDEFKDQLQSLTDEIRSRVEAAANDARAHVQALAKDIQGATEEFTRLRLPTDDANPYVKLFSDGERALESLRSRFALLTQEQRDAFAEQIRAAQDARRYDLQVRDAMSAVKLEFEAAELSRPFEELTGAMKRTLTVFEVGLKAATANPALLATANLVEARQRFRFGFNGNDRLLRGEGLQLDATGALGLNPDAIARQEFDNLLRLRTQYGGAPGLGGESIRNRLNEQLGSIYGRLSPQALAGVARDPQLSGVFAGAFRGQAAYNEGQLRRAARIAELGAPSLRLAETQLQRLSDLSGQPDANRNRTRAEFLSITGAIPREELTPELVAGRVAALREEASFRAESEERARQAFEETRAFQRALIGEGGQGGTLNEILGAIKNRNESVIVEVNNRSERATVSTLGSGFGQ